MPELDLGNVKGPQGKSAYQSALDAGFSGSEEAFNIAMAKAPDAVLYTAQSLTDEQKAQARGNIGAGIMQSAVLYTSQNLNNVQQQQARENIFAAPADKFPYFAVLTGATKEKTFEVETSWRTYLVVSTYSTQLGMWMVLPNDKVVIPVVENSAITITCETGKIHTKGAQVITIIYLGNS